MDGYGILWSAVLGIAGFGIGLLVAIAGTKALAKEMKNEFFRLKKNVVEAEQRFLENHRRELAQIIIARSAEAFESAFFKCQKFEVEMRMSSPDRIEAELKALADRFPYYQDFELLGTRHFVSYEDAVSWNSLDDIIDRYIDITKWLSLLLAKQKRVFHVFPEDEIRVFRDSMRRRKDRLFKQRIKDAMALFYKMRRAADAGNKSDIVGESYEDENVKVHYAPMQYSPEVAYGIHFKDTNEYGVYSFFSDYKSDKTYYSFYRSDRTFKDHKLLDA
jgi:hypothetical protein